MMTTFGFSIPDRQLTEIIVKMNEAFKYSANLGIVEIVEVLINKVVMNIATSFARVNTLKLIMTSKLYKEEDIYIALKNHQRSLNIKA